MPHHLLHELLGSGDQSRGRRCPVYEQHGVRGGLDRRQRSVFRVRVVEHVGFDLNND